jgi:hypothetical protein
MKWVVTFPHGRFMKKRYTPSQRINRTLPTQSRQRLFKEKMIHRDNSFAIDATTNLGLVHRLLPYSFRRITVDSEYDEGRREGTQTSRGYGALRDIHKGNCNSPRTVWENTEKMNEILPKISLPGTGAFADLFTVLAVSELHRHR